MQDKSIEELQEICLDELLGISEKRLLSIINATKCPSDTDSSDSNSDVEKIEGELYAKLVHVVYIITSFGTFVLEHISLEEISSESDDETDKSKRKRKIPSNTSKTDKKLTEEKNGKPGKKSE